MRAVTLPLRVISSDAESVHVSLCSNRGVTVCTVSDVWPHPNRVIKGSLVRQMSFHKSLPNLVMNEECHVAHSLQRRSAWEI